MEKLMLKPDPINKLCEICYQNEANETINAQHNDCLNCFNLNNSLLLQTQNSTASTNLTLANSTATKLTLKQQLCILG